jgi:hypothetical protein
MQNYGYIVSIINGLFIMISTELSFLCRSQMLKKIHLLTFDYDEGIFDEKVA